MPDITTTFFAILAAGFFVGIVVGLTGMGGGALMTPALIFLGVGETSTVITADLTAAAAYKTGGAIVHQGRVYVATCNLEGPYARQPTVVVCIGEK